MGSWWFELPEKTTVTSKLSIVHMQGYPSSKVEIHAGAVNGVVFVMLTVQLVSRYVGPQLVQTHTSTPPHWTADDHAALEDYMGIANYAVCQ